MRTFQLIIRLIMYLLHLAPYQHHRLPRRPRKKHKKGS